MNALYRRFFASLPVREVASDGALHLLSAAEVRFIRRRHRIALALAATLAALGFLAYYLPVYWFPEVFLTAPVAIEALALRFELPWVELVWGVLLMVAELYALVLVNIWAVHEIAVATGWIDAASKEGAAGSVLKIALEERSRDLLRYGIDPLLGMNRGLLFTFNLVLRLKGFLGSKALQYAVRRLLGRLAVREVLDFIGMPLYMVINAWSTHVVIREAKVIIMGRQLIDHLVRRLPRGLAQGPEAQELLYDTLQVVAVSKRDFHENHALLTGALLEAYAIPIRPQESLPHAYGERLRGAPAGLRRLCGLLLILGFVLDGQVSWRERRRLEALAAAGILEVRADEVERWCRAFVSGEGLEPLLAAYLEPAGVA